MARVLVDKDVCTGHARCFAAAAELLELDDDGFVAVEELELLDSQIDAAQAAVSACPERAIRIEAGIPD
jgi:ferredoxin